MEDTIQFQVPSTMSSAVREQIEKLLGGTVPDLRVIVLKDITTVLPDQAINPKKHAIPRAKTSADEILDGKAADVAAAIVKHKNEASPGFKSFLAHIIGDTIWFEFCSAKGGSLIPDGGAAIRAYAVAFSKFLKKHTCLSVYARPMAELTVSKPHFDKDGYHGVIYHRTALGERVYDILVSDGFFPKV